LADAVEREPGLPRRSLGEENLPNPLIKVPHGYEDTRT
jgi:hypothetical protein